MLKVFLLAIISTVLTTASVSSCDKQDGDAQAPSTTSAESTVKENVTRAIEIMDAAISHYFNTENGMAMSENYNPYTW